MKKFLIWLFVSVLAFFGTSLTFASSPPFPSATLGTRYVAGASGTVPVVNFPYSGSTPQYAAFACGSDLSVIDTPSTAGPYDTFGIAGIGQSSVSDSDSGAAYYYDTSNDVMSLMLSPSYTLTTYGSISCNSSSHLYMYLFDYSSEGGSHWINYATVELRNSGTTSAPVWSVVNPIYHKDRFETYSYQAVADDHDITDGGIGMLYTPTTVKPVQAIESVYFYMWRDASSSSDLEAKVYNMETDPPVLMATSETVAGSTAVLNEDYDPLTGTEGGWVKFTFATPVVLKGGDDYAIVVHNNDLEDYHLIGTATGDGYSAENKCRYISDVSPLTLTACSESDESVNVRLEFTAIMLGSPLDDVPTTGGGYAFGDTWTEGECPTGVSKIHTGSDFTTGGESGATVYATEAGDVVGVINPNNGWAKAVVIQHTHPNGWHYTTVTWHIDTDLAVTNPLTTVAKGALIGHVAYLATGSHLHFGLRIGAYTAGVSGLGALPVAVTTGCTDWPAFPHNFIDTNDSNYIQYQ